MVIVNLKIVFHYPGTSCKSQRYLQLKTGHPHGQLRGICSLSDSLRGLATLESLKNENPFQKTFETLCYKPWTFV